METKSRVIRYLVNIRGTFRCLNDEANSILNNVQQLATRTAVFQAKCLEMQNLFRQRTQIGNPAGDHDSAKFELKTRESDIRASTRTESSSYGGQQEVDGTSLVSRGKLHDDAVNIKDCHCVQFGLGDSGEPEKQVHNEDNVCSLENSLEDEKKSQCPEEDLPEKCDDLNVPNLQHDVKGSEVTEENICASPSSQKEIFLPTPSSTQECVVVSPEVSREFILDVHGTSDRENVRGQSVNDINSKINYSRCKSVKSKMGKGKKKLKMRPGDMLRMVEKKSANLARDTLTVTNSAHSLGDMYCNDKAESKENSTSKKSENSRRKKTALKWEKVKKSFKKFGTTLKNMFRKDNFYKLESTVENFDADAQKEMQQSDTVHSVNIQ